MSPPRFLIYLSTAVILLSAPSKADFGWLIFQLDFIPVGDAEFTVAADSLVNMMSRLLSTKIPNGEFKLVVISNSTK